MSDYTWQDFSWLDGDPWHIIAEMEYYEEMCWDSFIADMNYQIQGIMSQLIELYNDIS